VLLQAVEAYSGTCIMATNRRDNIDSAFLRRLRYVLEFPRPDAGLRCQLWRRLAQALSPQSAEILAPTCKALAETLDFTGAQIKNAMRTATIEAMRAGRTSLTAQDLTAGAEHELMKEGRALTQAEALRLGGAHA
jgi:ATP-dependent 26S proteasome regulatory subunit